MTEVQKQALTKNLPASPPQGQGTLKETGVELIPAEWEVKRLEEICRLKRGGVDPTEIPETPYVSLSHIDSGDPQLHQWGSSTEVKSRKKNFLPGDVLYARLRPYLDKAVLAEIEGVCSTDILFLKAKPEKTTPGFLVNLLHTKRFLEYAVSTSSGTNLPRNRWSSLRDYEVGFPPLPEQRRIAGALRTIQEAIATQEHVIAAARELKRSLMERLFTYGPGADLAPTKEIEFGEVPEHWDIGECCIITASAKNVASFR
jgi:type I restriction enzyme, S subunit